MASEVDISNLALAHLGDAANISSFDEGSAQAAHCGTFYPIARDALLERHTWGFATTRDNLALLSVTPPSGWQFVYAVPNNMLNTIAVLDPAAGDDYSVAMPVEFSQSGTLNTGQGIYTPQPFEIETLPNGTDVIYTNQINAVLRYSVRVTDPSKFSPLFIVTLGWFLGGDLAGPVLKGDAGRKAAMACYAQGEKILLQAQVSDANQRLIQPRQNVSWMAGR